MSTMTLKEAVERMQNFLNTHPDLATSVIYASEGEDGEFKSVWNEVVIELPNGHTKTVVSFI